MNIIDFFGDKFLMPADIFLIIFIVSVLFLIVTLLDNEIYKYITLSIINTIAFIFNFLLLYQAGLFADLNYNATHNNIYFIFNIMLNIIFYIIMLNKIKKLKQ